ncbi:MAG: ATP-binding protein [Bacteroidaceae bacterium]|nr:ATP-binding protein [Bacteroidaceae bacterium]
MIKRKISHFISDYYKNNRNALLITGARQIGKTFSIREFGRSFKTFVEINFVETPEAIEIFKGAKSSNDILLRLSALTTTPLIKGETLIFFDEVQKCPEIVTAIKFLVDEGSYRYILSGSLLGVELKDLRSEPVGYMGIKDMYPIDFEEFISYIGINENIISTLRQAWEQRTPVDQLIHTKMMELFRLYLIVGGMPAVVSKYLETNNLQEVMTIQQDIIRLYKRDIAQYDPNNKLYIEEIFNLIPPELNAKNKRFILKRLNENAKFERYQNSFLWLTNAGVALPVYNVEEPKTPLLLARSRNLFKLFQNDIGLLAAQYAEGIQLRIIKGDKDINYGSIYENAVAQEFAAHGITPYYYNNKKRGELDFVIELNGRVVPIEVKSGKDYEVHRALSNIMDCGEYDLPEAIILTNDNLQVVNKFIYAPIYMTMFIERNNDAPAFYKIDLSGLQ